MVENSFERYISLFIFYIIPINYATYMDQSLIFEPNWIQNTIVPKFICRLFWKVTILFFKENSIFDLLGSWTYIFPF